MNENDKYIRYPEPEITVDLSAQNEIVQIKLPEITDERAVEFGRAVLLIQSLETTVGHLTNRINAIRQRIVGFEMQAQETGVVFRRIIDGVNSTKDLPDDLFTGTLLHPAAESLTNKELRDLFAAAQALIEKRAEINKQKAVVYQQAGASAFGLSFGRTWQQVFADLPKESISENKKDGEND